MGPMEHVVCARGAVACSCKSLWARSWGEPVWEALSSQAIAEQV